MLRELRFDITELTTGIICHQVNCQGVMGAGLAKQIRQKFPESYVAYRRAAMRKQLKLKHVICHTVSMSPRLVIAHLCAQDAYGRDKNIQYTNYNALTHCLRKVKEYRDVYYSSTLDFVNIYIPYKIGCGLANGRWQIVSKIIEDEIPDAVIVKR